MMQQRAIEVYLFGEEYLEEIVVVWKERGTITSLMFIVELKSFFVRSLCEWILAFDRIPTLSLVDLIDLLNFKVQ